MWSNIIKIPEQPVITVDPDDPEIKKVATLLTRQDQSPLRTIDQKLERYSSWNRAVRHIAVLQQKVVTKAMSTDFEAARKCILRAVQSEHFSQELQLLRGKKTYLEFK